MLKFITSATSESLSYVLDGSEQRKVTSEGVHPELWVEGSGSCLNQDRLLYSLVTKSQELNTTKVYFWFMQS